jgi:hypothetical protein
VSWEKSSSKSVWLPLLPENTNILKARRKSKKPKRKILQIWHRNRKKKWEMLCLSRTVLSKRKLEIILT